MMPCIIVIGYQHFRGPCCLHHQGKASQPRKPQIESSLPENIKYHMKICCFNFSIIISLFLFCVFLSVYFASLVMLKQKIPDTLSVCVTLIQ
jgi:hypothetical protein